MFDNKLFIFKYKAMRNKFLFKTMIDILYITFLLVFVALVITIPLGFMAEGKLIIGGKPSVMIYDGVGIGVFPIIVTILKIVCYAIFLRGLYFLRKVAHFILRNQLFDKELIEKIKIAGNHFLYTGVLYFATLFLAFIGRMTNGKLALSYDVNLMIPCFLVIIGLFFVIQSEALLTAKGSKEENELTV